MSDPTSKPPAASPPDEPADPQTANDAQRQDGVERYEAPKLRRLGTLLELTQSGTRPFTEAFRGSR